MARSSAEQSRSKDPLAAAPSASAADQDSEFRMPWSPRQAPDVPGSTDTTPSTRWSTPGFPGSIPIHVWVGCASDGSPGPSSFSNKTSAPMVLGDRPDSAPPRAAVPSPRAGEGVVPLRPRRCRHLRQRLAQILAMNKQRRAAYIAAFVIET